MTKHTVAQTLTMITSLEEVPQFGSEQEESTYWQTHTFSEELWNSLPPVPEDIMPPARLRTRSVSLRLDESTLQRMKTLSARRHKGYQTLLKEFVVERLYEEEKREGLVG